VGNDGEVADVVHAVCCAAEASTATPLHGKLISRSDVKARRAVLDIKKRHVEEVTRLPTKGMATACWAFIVAKSIGRETAPALVFRPLQAANKDFLPQLIHKFLWIACGSNPTVTGGRRFRRQTPPSGARQGQILAVGANNLGDPTKVSRRQLSETVDNLDDSAGRNYRIAESPGRRPRFGWISGPVSATRSW
jgi:hypothetical protein